jgi:hypothetical protein
MSRGRAVTDMWSKGRVQRPTDGEEVSPPLCAMADNWGHRVLLAASATTRIG